MRQCLLDTPTINPFYVLVSSNSEEKLPRNHTIADFAELFLYNQRLTSNEYCNIMYCLNLANFWSRLGLNSEVFDRFMVNSKQVDMLGKLCRVPRLGTLLYCPKIAS